MATKASPPAQERPRNDRIALIRSKLRPPAPPLGAALRTRLFDSLAIGRVRALTLVSAPAGYGKTTLLSQWVAEPATPTSAWVSLDSGDADPTRFWKYILSALAEIAPPAGRQSLPALARRPERVQAEILPILMEELDQAGRDLVLVLEDYHLAECAAVAESMAYFADNRPVHLQLVVSARSDPALPLGRWRANDQLAEIRSEQLRFGENEVVEFFRGAGIDGFSPGQLDKLTARTEGWPAALRLAAIIVGTQGDRGGVVEAFAGSTRQVADYLATEVLQSVGPDLRAFLLQTSVLPRLCGPLCDTVTGRSDSAAILRDLSQAGLFIDPVGLDGRWYRYHQLFAEALGLELEVEAPQRVPDLHARASAWFEREGDLESAIEHAIVARDPALAGRLILFQLRALRGAGHLATVERWLATLSWPAALEEPDLAIARAVTAGERSQPDEADRWLGVAGNDSRDTLTAAGLPRRFRTDSAAVALRGRRCSGRPRGGTAGDRGSTHTEVEGRGPGRAGPMQLPARPVRRDGRRRHPGPHPSAR